MELRQIRHFLAVAEHKQFGRAAEAVSLSQQALSHSVATLEADLQVKLFERGRFGAELTPMGRLFEKRARMACGELDFAAAELMAFKGGVDGQLRIGVTPNFAADVAPEAVLLFAKARPRIRISVTVGTSKQLFELLTAGKIELAFTCPLAIPDPESGLEHRPLDCAYQHALNLVSMNLATRCPRGASMSPVLGSIGGAFRTASPSHGRTYSPSSATPAARGPAMSFVRTAWIWPRR